ncbi:glycerol-3-phosphate O-acyltransferase [Gloeopeniophorella convolvens]|nr:glycerol-3-phosphate O-acyltransferase [Gloeopeniophorella convolvens]
MMPSHELSESSRQALATNLPYDLALLFFRGIINIFFREVRPRGAFNIPRDGPVIFVGAPHSNQFLDLLLALQVYRETGRRPSFLVAAKSMQRRIVGFLARNLSSIPVARAADYARPGTGKVYLSPDDPCLVIGEGTKFLEEFKPRMQVMLSKALNSSTAEVTQVISDTRLRIKGEFHSETDKTTKLVLERAEEARAQGKDGLDFKTIPHVDQHEMFRHVYQQLEDGGCIAIFPEGGSHDRTDLLPFKAGFSMMALGAMANNPNLKVKIVPVGLSYFHAHRFRSRAVVEFGPPLDIASELVEKFKAGGSDRRDAVSKLLNEAYDALKAVTVRAPDYDTLMLIQAARRLYQPPGQHLTLGQVVELNKRFLLAYSYFKDEPRIQALRAKVLKYNRLLRDLGLRDHQVPRAQKASWKTSGLLLYRIALLLVWTVFSLPGVVLHSPIFITASIVSKLKAKEALAASVVKVAGRDVLATWKVLISLGMTPALYAFYASVATVFAIKINAPLDRILWTPFLVLTALPCIGYAALKFGEAGMDVLKSLGPLVIALVPGKHHYLERLKRIRQELAKELGEAIDEFGPQIWEDFDKHRLIVPSASVPPSSGTPGLWRRKSGAGAVDAQGNLLSHPMTWLDERLFGWSHSAEASREVSQANSPRGSDDEDNGDYDSLWKAKKTDGETSKSHSRRGSYADLQKLRLTSVGN